MIGSFKNNRENYPRKCFLKQEKEIRVKFNHGLSANRPSNNWALVLGAFCECLCLPFSLKNGKQRDTYDGIFLTSAKMRL